MSRYSDYDDYEGDPEQILAQGRWERNARAVLKSGRGRKALAELREALLALPEPRLIDGALCTVGGAGRIPDVTAGQIASREASLRERGVADADIRQITEWDREDCEEKRERLAGIAGREGQGVCAVGAFAWYRKVQNGTDPEAAFADLPTIFDGDGEGDALTATAEVGQAAGMAYTLAWELAYRNDETYSRMTPEERWTAFLEWIGQQLASAA